MNKFNKFLKKGEDLKKVFYCQPNSLRMYFIILLFIPLFFVIVPIFRAGWQGLSLWLFVFLFLVFWLAKEIVEQKNIYLLTNTRLIHIKSSSKTDFKQFSFINLDNITEVRKQGSRIIIISQQKKFYLLRLVLADELYNYLDSYIKRQNLV